MNTLQIPKCAFREVETLTPELIINYLNFLRSNLYTILYKNNVSINISSLVTPSKNIYHIIIYNPFR